MNTMKLMTRKASGVAHVAQPRARLPLQARRCRKVAIVAMQAVEKPGIAKFADSIGLPTEEGLFGFKPFSEMWCGRLAMMGFISSILVEFQTGQGTIQQLGLLTPSNNILAAITLAVLGGSIVGAGVTVYRGLSGKMPKQEAERYKKFLLLDNENEEIEATRKEGTAADKFFSANNAAQIQAAREGMPADRFLTNDDGIAAASAAKAEGTPADAVLTMSEASTSAAPTPTPKPVKSYDDIWFPNYEMKYARDVELSNGRSAMVGFLAAVLVEAATGKGILLQLIMWGKLSGLLGYESGF